MFQRCKSCLKKDDCLDAQLETEAGAVCAGIVDPTAEAGLTQCTSINVVTTPLLNDEDWKLLTVSDLSRYAIKIR